MKIRPSLFLVMIAASGIAATTYTITQLTANNSPSDGTLIEIYDPSASPKSGKYVLTNLARATQAGITNSLGYVPVNKAGDTGIGTLAISVAANSTPMTLGGYSLTGSSALPLLDLVGTWNTSGNASALKLTVTDTASGSSAKFIQVLGGAAGSTEYFSIRKDGFTAFGGLGIGFSNFYTAGGSIAGNTATIGGATGLNVNALAIGSDTILLRDAANTFQLGSDSATASDQEIKGPDGSGTDKVGGGLYLSGGKSTGTAAGGEVVLRTANSSTTGSSANSLSERFHAPAKFVELTESTATTLFTVPVAAANYVGLTATVTIFASDGTDHQALTSVLNVNGVAKTTAITPTVTQVDGTTAASSGTLTCTYTVTDNGSNVLAVKANAVSSLTQTTLRAKIVITAINSNGTAAITEQ